MKKCELCGLANPEEARFCMKCGKDLDASGMQKAPSGTPEYDSFTPAGSEKSAPLRGGHRASEENTVRGTPAGEQPPPPVPEDTSMTASAGFDVEPTEIHPSGATTDFRSRPKHCEICGASNPRDQRFCKLCGRELEEAGRDEAVSAGQSVEKLTTVPEPSEPASGQKPVLPVGDGTDSIPTELDAEVSRSEEAVIIPEAPHKQKFCDRCGNSNPHDQKFCRLCGQPFDEELQDEDGPSPEPIPLIPSDQNYYEPSHMASLTPSFSDFHEDSQAHSSRKRSRGTRESRIHWGVREWLTLIVATVIVIVLLWLFAFGGAKNLFDSKADSIGKADRTMLGLRSFQLSAVVTLESSSSGLTGGSGYVNYESPDRSAYDINVTAPGNKPVRVQHIQVKDRPYIFVDGRWQSSDPATTGFEVGRLWSGYSGLEDLGSQAFGGYDCFHYKYRIPPETITRLLGVWQPTGVSDAVMEAWIDKSSSRIVHLKAEVFNLKMDGERSRAALLFDLAATGQDYRIVAPI